jgi:uncharacterized protein YdiU (UPF0061 family)
VAIGRFSRGTPDAEKMTILGLTLDQPSFGFLDDCDPGHIGNR